MFMKKTISHVDRVLQQLFGIEEHQDLLISLVNAILEQEDQVTLLTLLNPYNPQEYHEDQASCLDIQAQGKDGKGRRIIIQVNDDEAHEKKALYDWAKVYTEQFSTEKRDKTPSKTIMIDILNSNRIPSPDRYHHVFRLESDSGSWSHLEDLELHTIELKKFCQDSSKDLVTKIHTPLDRWMAFLTWPDLLNQEDFPEVFNTPSLKKALHILEGMHFEGVTIE
ncbi:hypothetical protein RSOCI_00410 [Rhabdochlamydiaceae symbiont of Dictyostelium giganteum]